MQEHKEAQEFETPPPLTTWQSVVGFFVAALLGVLLSSAVLALLSSVYLVPPRERMLRESLGMFAAVLIVFGPFWRTLRRDPPLVGGIACGLLAAIAMWWLRYVS